MNNPYSNRNSYRKLISKKHFFSFQISIEETDIHIQVPKNGLEKKAEEIIIETRKVIKDYIKKHPDFKTTLLPYPEDPISHPVIQKMINAGKKTNTGPMASVAGAVCQETGYYLLNFCDEFIIENGGDVFFKTKNEFISAVYSGKNSPFSNKLGLKLSSSSALSICTSSGTLGHSLNFGKADSVTIASKDAYLADGYATALSNMVKTDEDIKAVIELAMSKKEIEAIVIIKDNKTGAAGKIELVRI
ncbi:MAG: UPF0280 family protein [Desulforegulaceae bacterium]|nr:UPF0280 family protein [Desulforegulaceae bacterium]